jgi:hypothetical protein
MDKSYYDLMQVCANGHKITAYGRSQPENLKNRCPKCGSETYTNCPLCNAEIHGYKHIPGVFYNDKSEVPDYCHNCGNPFPWINKTQKKRNLSIISSLDKLFHILKRFHLVARQLRNRYNNRPTITIEDEYDMQDLLHAILKIEFDDIRPEEWTPSYAGASSRMDFLLKNDGIVIEAKRTRKGLEAKEIGEQLLVDIAKYKEHPNCKILICFVYDMAGRINNPTGLQSDLERHSSERLKVSVYIYSP